MGKIPAAFEAVFTVEEHLRARRGAGRATSVREGIWCNAASNDYLGLARDERVVAAAQDAVACWGASASASRVVSGTFPIHAELESALAALVGVDSALVFSSGYAANLAVLASLGQRGVQLLLDEHVHASLHDAVRLSAAKAAFFGHNRLDHLRQLLEQCAGEPTVVVVEGVYSVLGDAADLTAVSALCEDFGALLVVDEAHSLGVRGGGAGLCAEAGIAGKPYVVVTASLGKALGSQGGVVLCSGYVRDFLVNSARTFIFDTALSPASAGAALEAVRILGGEGVSLTAELEKNARHIRQSLAPLGLMHDDAAGAVQSLKFPGSSGQARECAEALAQAGVLVGCFRPPSVPDGVARLRITAQAGQSREILDSALQQIMSELSSYM